MLLNQTQILEEELTGLMWVLLCRFLILLDHSKIARVPLVPPETGEEGSRKGFIKLIVTARVSVLGNLAAKHESTPPGRVVGRESALRLCRQGKAWREPRQHTVQVPPRRLGRLTYTVPVSAAAIRRRATRRVHQTRTFQVRKLHMSLWSRSFFHNKNGTQTYVLLHLFQYIPLTRSPIGCIPISRKSSCSGICPRIVDRPRPGE